MNRLLLLLVWSSCINGTDFLRFSLRLCTLRLWKGRTTVAGCLLASAGVPEDADDDEEEDQEERLSPALPVGPNGARVASAQQRASLWGHFAWWRIGQCVCARCTPCALAALRAHQHFSSRTLCSAVQCIGPAAHTNTSGTGRQWVALRTRTRPPAGPLPLGALCTSLRGHGGR